MRQTKYKCLYIIRWAEELALLWVDLPLRARICRFLPLQGQICRFLASSLSLSDWVEKKIKSFEALQTQPSPLASEKAATTHNASTINQNKK